MATARQSAFGVIVQVFKWRAHAVPKERDDTQQLAFRLGGPRLGLQSVPDSLARCSVHWDGRGSPLRRGAASGKHQEQTGNQCGWEPADVADHLVHVRRLLLPSVDGPDRLARYALRLLLSSQVNRCFF
ncbi:MAG TPA: hypothetical protein VKM94_23000 [Blastocatellia bacterium]|nr:hypothetical protein [Blastocatellia bacterium]